jgi:hypothetical protein
MPLTNLEEALRPLARELIAKGRLPRGALSRMWGGNGTGQLCSLCNKAIERFQIEYKVKHTDALVQTLRFHTACLSAWQLECARDDCLGKHP